MQLGLSRHYLIRTPNLGQKSVEAIILALSELGLQIEGPKPSPVRPDVAANA
jgi:DNA-directed RNA polymerase alpha subunit